MVVLDNFFLGILFIETARGHESSQCCKVIPRSQPVPGCEDGRFREILSFTDQLSAKRYAVKTPFSFQTLWKSRFCYLFFSKNNRNLVVINFFSPHCFSKQ